MRKMMILGLLVLMGLLLMACEEDGELRIRNRTNAMVQARVDDSTPMDIDAWSGWSRYYTEDTTVKVSFEGLYVYPDSTTRSVIVGLPTTVNILPDAGALKIVNDSTFAITEVYISAHDASEWGENQIADSLSVDAERIWTTDGGAWDIKIVSTQGTPLYKMNQTVTVNETLALDVSDFLPFAGLKKTGTQIRTTRRPIAR